VPLNDTPPSPSIRTSLKQRVFNAGAWTLGGYALSQIIRFGSNLLMTRLLVPEMFGVIAIAVIVMVGLSMFSDVGLKQSIVQSKRGSDPHFLNTAWVTQILRSVLLWIFALGIAVMVFVAAGAGPVPTNSVYADPSLPYVIAVLSFTLAIGGWQSTKLYEASRNLSLGRITTIEVASQIVGLLCMIGWVIIDRTVWALVAGAIFSTISRTLLSHVLLPGTTNRWEWDKSASHEFFHFGKWIFISTILSFLVLHTDRLLLGGLVNATVLGVYVIAYLVFNSIEQMLTKIIGEVSFPAFSEVARERPSELRASYYRFHFFVAPLAYFCSGTLMMSGQALIGLLYDQRYEAAGWMLQILAAALLALPFGVATQCFMALGATRLLSYVGTLRLATLLVLTPIGFHLFDLQGFLLGILLSHFSQVPLTIFYQIKYGLFDLRKELVLIPAVIVGLAMGKAINLAIGY